MDYIKFTLFFLFQLIKENPAKIIIIAITCVMFYFAGKIPDSIAEYDVAKNDDGTYQCLKIDNNYVFVCKDIDHDKIKYTCVWDSKEIPIKNGKIYLSSYHPGNMFLWIGFFICLLVVIVGTLIGDNAVGWNLDRCKEVAFSKLITCEEENGEYYYFALGRLIQRRTMPLDPKRWPDNIDVLGVSSFSQLKVCPKYQTKSQRRNSIIRNLGL